MKNSLALGLVVAALSLWESPALGEDGCPRVSGVLKGEVHARLFGKAAEAVRVTQTGCSLVSISVSDDAPLEFRMTGLALAAEGKDSGSSEIHSGYFLANEVILIRTSIKAPGASAQQDIIVIHRDADGIVARAISRSTDAAADTMTGRFRLILHKGKEPDAFSPF